MTATNTGKKVLKPNTEAAKANGAAAPAASAPAPATEVVRPNVDVKVVEGGRAERVKEAENKAKAAGILGADGLTQAPRAEIMAKFTEAFGKELGDEYFKLLSFRKGGFTGETREKRPFKVALQDNLKELRERLTDGLTFCKEEGDATLAVFERCLTSVTALDTEAATIADGFHPVSTTQGPELPAVGDKVALLEHVINSAFDGMGYKPTDVWEVEFVGKRNPAVKNSVYNVRCKSLSGHGKNIFIPTQIKKVS